MYTNRLFITCMSQLGVRVFLYNRNIIGKIAQSKMNITPPSPQGGKWMSAKATIVSPPERSGEMPLEMR